MLSLAVACVLFSHTMRLHLDPPMNQWQARQRTRQPPIIATGHQAGLWHPGILAKCIAAVEYAKAVGGEPLFVLVDHDDNDAMRLELPVIEADRLATHVVQLGESLPGVALVSQPKIDWNHAAKTLREARDQLGPRLRCDIEPIIGAADSMRAIEGTRADQMTKFMQKLWQPIIGSLPMVMATNRIDHALVERMLRDAARCVQCYNEAVRQHPNTGIPLLNVERDRVELPLWYLGNPWGFRADESASEILDWPRDAHGRQQFVPRARQRVYADLSDSAPLLVRDDGEPVPSARRDGIVHHIGLAPRALSLTAMLRSTVCDLFIHGHGGGVYDRVMEAWWHAWIGQPLAPMAVVSADVNLDFPGVPLAQPQDLTRAIWYAHHLPHNLDRHLPREWVDVSLAARKREILAQMNDDQDAKRRAAPFRELHRINQTLGTQHAEVIRLADEQVAQVRTGVQNRRIASKRDWAFPLYPPSSLDDLAAQIRAQITNSK